jgi:hypothetical protein
VANPPYIPAPSAERLLLPGLWGGPDGSGVLCRLMDQDISYLLLLVPGISNPEKVILHSLKQGYYVHNFLLISLPFGQYTSQDYVQDWLLKMHKSGQAFFLTGITFWPGFCLVKKGLSIQIIVPLCSGFSLFPGENTPQRQRKLPGSNPLKK